MNYSLTYLTLPKEMRPFPNNLWVDLPMPLPNPLMWLLNSPHKSCTSVRDIDRTSFLIIPNLGLFKNGFSAQDSWKRSGMISL